MHVREIRFIQYVREIEHVRPLSNNKGEIFSENLNELARFSRSLNI